MIKDTFKQIIIYLLEKEAQAVLKKYKPKVVAITGTVGKTSTKDAIYTVLSQFYYCRKSPKSFNSELGVPLTILGLPNADRSPFGWIKNILDGFELIIFPHHYPEWLVLEVGTDRPGDITHVTTWLKPDMVVVTKLSRTPVHVEAFDSVEAVFREKGKLVEALKRGGTLLLNADDEDVLAYRNMTEEKVLLFGKGNGSDMRAMKHKVKYKGKLPVGITFEVLHKDMIVPVELSNTLGEHHAYHVLVALLAAAALNENFLVASQAFKDHPPTPGRMSLVEGMKGTMIIDDTYNSSPVALHEALNTLEGLKATRKIAVLGDMLELGKFSIDEHKKAGKRASECVDILITVGTRSRYIAEGALIGGMPESRIFQFEDSVEAGKFLQNIMEKCDIVLVKGSQGMRMEKVVEEVMAHPEDKERLLVRQDAAWQKRK